MNDNTDDPRNQPRRRPERPLPSMDEDAAIELFEIAAENGHLGASAAIALLCEGKIPAETCKKHFDKADNWILKSAEDNDVWGLLFLGIMYFDGHRVEQNYEQAAHFFQKAADVGNSCAQGFLGYMHSVGHGVPQNIVMHRELVFLKINVRHLTGLNWPANVATSRRAHSLQRCIAPAIW